MAKFSINIKDGSIAKKDIIVGIDLGTTHSLVAYIDEKSKQPVIIKKGSSVLVPSVIHFRENGETLVGEMAKKALLQSPASTISSVKRLMGKAYKDLK